MELPGRISEALQAGDDAQVAELTQQSIELGIDPRQILDEGLIAAMATVGERFKAHEIFLPDVLLAARAMYAGMDRLKPLLSESGVKARGTVVIGSVQGDLHDIGKNLVGIMLKGAGYEVVDLGNDVAPERFVEAARTHGAGVIGMSALLTTTMPVMKRVVELVSAHGDSTIKTVVGGAPVSAEFAQGIGADAYGFDAADAVDQVARLLEQAAD